jgi:hypothetical protein
VLEGRFTEFVAESVAHSAERKGQGAGSRGQKEEGRRENADFGMGKGMGEGK